MPTAQLLNTAGVFAAGFLMRPIGGWLFRRIADRKGRKISLAISVTMMCGGSLLIACLPTYATIGAWAPFLLPVARLVQAIFGGSAEYVALGLKSVAHETAFFWYVTAMMAIAFPVAFRLPRKPSFLHDDH